MRLSGWEAGGKGPVRRGAPGGGAGGLARAGRAAILGLVVGLVSPPAEVEAGGLGERRAGAGWAGGCVRPIRTRLLPAPLLPL